MNDKDFGELEDWSRSRQYVQPLAYRALHEIGVYQFMLAMHHVSNDSNFCIAKPTFVCRHNINPLELNLDIIRLIRHLTQHETHSAFVLSVSIPTPSRVLKIVPFPCFTNFVRIINVVIFIFAFVVGVVR